ncbi:MAG TPA: hypothetical protein PLK90_00275 [Clostridiales bacterium]|nr:hypothetical protein [Clostridiales bacterium]HQP68813.1 hypothetical protein [Clostridiales bacterium]
MKKLFNIVLLLTVMAAFAQVDMIGRKVTATGVGMPNPDHKNAAQRRFGALRAAEMDAVRRIIEELKGMYVTSETTVSEAMTTSDVITTKTEGIAKYYELVGAPVYKEDGTVEMTVEMSLGDLDWAGKVVQVTGIGAGKARPMALRAAELDAKRKILERTKGLYLASASMMKDGAVEMDKIDALAEGIVKNAHTVKGSEKYFDDGSVEITCEVKLGDNLQPIPGFASVLMDNMDFDEEYPIVPEATYKLSDIVSSTGAAAYTGLIIDCKGVDVRPALAPKVFSQAGTEVYGSSMVSESFATQQGMIGYLKDMNKAKENTRIGSNPLIIKAVGVKGENKADIVLSDADAAKIADAAKTQKFLGECRVMAILK